MATTNIELLAAVLAGTRRRDVQALLTDIYPILITEDNAIIGTVNISGISDRELRFEVPIISGNTGISLITQKDVTIKYTEVEYPVLGSTAVTLITQSEVIVTGDSEELSVTGSTLVTEITQYDVLIAYSGDEQPVVGTTLITEITQG